MKFNNLLSISVTLLALVISSCASSSLSVISMTPHEEPLPELTIGTIQLESIYSYTPDHKELKSIIISTGKECGFNITDASSGTAFPGTYRIDFLLREKTYVEGFKTILSTAILAAISDSDEQVLYRISYIHDGKKSLTSLVYVREALLEIFTELGKRADQNNIVVGDREPEDAI